jgi:hypothetical protein
MGGTWAKFFSESAFFRRVACDTLLREDYKGASRRCGETSDKELPQVPQLIIETRLMLYRTALRDLLAATGLMKNKLHI